MGNANGREEEERDDGEGLENGDLMSPSSVVGRGASTTSRSVSVLDSNGVHNHNNNSPPDHAPARSSSPFLFPPQAPVAPLRRPDVSPVFDQIRQNESHEAIDEDQPPEKGIPTVIIWSYGGNDVAVKGSWDNFTSMKRLQRSGKDHSILLVLPSGIYHYKLIVDGESKYIPDLPSVTDEMGCVCNLLDVHDYVPENIDSAVEFEAPPSPDHTYSQAFPAEDDFTKDPSAAPPQLHLTVLDEASSSKPQHVVLNHLYIEKGWASQSLVALGLTHRFQSKYVTVCLYKPLRR
ncbi:SNF1-RELATED PROTEIN KINASE REGULATORY SUBUNIT BETA-1 [Salix purpurea]|uniref:SNF1-RELATED PROTEIN KINASE REGULATORY SUBUNIT BETA-1 n=1 Tax=Salix purpurea TaxID=77065 RepID=A0A9Q1A296_SALPP|nr:SNF1-RELATED PROTEIN KINASE REGULATORY SUBUNIT BETA-1 [Salix purpurea]